MRRFSLVAACLLALLAGQTSLLAQGPQQYVISPKIYEQTGGAKKPRVVSEPTMLAVADRKFSFLSGGELPPRPHFGGEPIEFGTRVDGIIRTSAAGERQLQLTISLTSPGANQPDQEVEVVAGQIYRIRAPLPQQKPKVIQLGDGRFLELHVQPISGQILPAEN